MTALAVAAAMVAVGCFGRPHPAASRRLGAILAASRSPSNPAQGDGRPGRPVIRVFAAVVVLAGGLAVGGPVGIGLGVVGAVVVVSVRPRAIRRLDADDVPVVVDLLAGCLSAGAALPDALDAAAGAADEVLREHARLVVAALRSGAPPEEAWRGWLCDPWLAPVARTAVRTAATGAGAAEDLRRTAARLRARRRALAQHRVRQASVWLVVPLGLCFLPAFVLVAVVPIVAGLVPTLR